MCRKHSCDDATVHNSSWFSREKTKKRNKKACCGCQGEVIESQTNAKNVTEIFIHKCNSAASCIIKHSAGCVILCEILPHNLYRKTC